MISFHVFVTGAFGALGSLVVERLADRGCRITCLAPKTAEVKAARKAMRKRYRFDMAWGDLRDAESLPRLLARAKPDAILHLEEVRPPAAYEDPGLARAVNVEGTRALIRAAAALPRPPRFVFASGSHVHGPRNGVKALPLLAADSPFAPADTFGRHKVLCEESLVGSGLPYVILRLGRLFPLAPSEAPPVRRLKMLFELPASGRVHPVHPRDAALAFVGAATIPRAGGQTFMIGGGDDWKVRQGDLLRALDSDGLVGGMPRSAFCLPHPEVDAAWHFEDWMDTGPAQEILQFQEHGLFDSLVARRAARPARQRVGDALAPVRRPLLLRHSPYHGEEPFLQRRPTWERLATLFDLDPGAE